jgi:serine/threonine protein kinase
MATVHLGRLAGEAGFARTVAIKRLHPHLLLDPAFADMFAEEARVAARIRHPNVVPTVDVVCADDELLLVMEYIDGDSLSQLFKTAKGRVPLPIALAIMTEILHGLHAAHEARDEQGRPLCVVHRDVSPQNVIVGADGAARLVDFGIARASGRQGNTVEGDIKGKVAYMAPEQIRCESITRQADIYAAGIILWELLTGERLFASENEGATLEKILCGWVAPPSSIVRDLPPELDDITLRALSPQRSERFRTARDMAIALEDASSRALPRDVAEWVERTAKKALAGRRAMVARIESSTVERAEREEEGTDPVFVSQLHTVVMPTSTLPPRRAPQSYGRHVALFGTCAAILMTGVLLARAPEPARAAIPAPVVEQPIVFPQPVPLPVQTTQITQTTQTAQTAPTSIPAPVVTVTATAHPTATISARPVTKRVVAMKKPCIAKVDPSTKKTVYQGDCE